MTLNYRKLASNALAAFFAQGISMLISAMTSIFVPKIMGVEDFGYWQLFMFYASYVGFFHLGINDGVYLEQGGKTRSEINKKEIASEFRFSIVYQSAFALILVFVGQHAIESPSRAFVITATALFLLLNNLSSFLGFLLQSMNEIKKYSISILVDRLIFLIPLFIFLIIRCADFKLYILAYACSKTCCLLYCIYNLRDIIFAKALPFKQTLSLSAKSIRVGFKLTIANVSSMLIIGIARALVDMEWGIKDFGQVSFALSLVTFFLTFVSQASLVLFPALRTIDKKELVHLYSSIKIFMSYFFPFAYLIFFPIAWIMRLWLPQYSIAFSYLAILMPICVFDTKMDICCTTYMKVMRMEKQLLILNLSSVCISAIGCYFVVKVFHSINGILIVAVSVVILRSIIAEMLVNLRLNVTSDIITLFELFVTVIYIMLSFAPTHIFAAGTFILISAYAIGFRRFFSMFINSIKKHFIKTN